MNKLITEYAQIQTKINQLTDAKLDINKSLRIRQIEILQQLDDEFIKSGTENIEVYKVRIRYNSMLKFLSEELGLPVNKYVENLKLLTRKMGIPDENWLFKQNK